MTNIPKTKLKKSSFLREFRVALVGSKGIFPQVNGWITLIFKAKRIERELCIVVKIVPFSMK
jgi:hypothetical protein